MVIILILIIKIITHVAPRVRKSFQLATNTALVSVRRLSSCTWRAAWLMALNRSTVEVASWGTNVSGGRTQVEKTKQSKTKQNKTKQNKAKQNKTKQASTYTVNRDLQLLCQFVGVVEVGHENGPKIQEGEGEGEREVGVYFVVFYRLVKRSRHTLGQHNTQCNADLTTTIG